MFRGSNGTFQHFNISTKKMNTNKTVKSFDLIDLKGSRKSNW